MPYGILKVDTVTFTSSGVDKSVTISGLVQNPTFSGNVTSTSTISGVTIQGGTLVSGATVTGSVGQFTSLTAGTVTLTSGVFASGTAAAPSVSIGTATNGLYSPGADQLAISTAGTGRVFVASDGKVGIGTSSVSAVYLQTINGNGSSTVGGLSLRNNDTETLSIGNVTAANNVDSEIWNPRNGYLRFATNNQERLRITSDGKVGIGTSSPGYPLDVVADVSAWGLNIRGRSADNIGYIRFSPNSGLTTYAALGTPTANNLSIDTNGIERLRIDSSGHLLVGTSASRETSGVEWQVQTEGNTYTGYSAITNTNSAIGSYLILGKSRGTGVGSSTIVQVNDALGTVGFVGANGSNVNLNAAYITCAVDDTPSAGVMPGRLGFFTTPSGSGTPTERMVIKADGKVGIGTSSPTYKLQVTGTTAVQRIGSSGATFADPAFNIYDFTHAVEMCLTGINGSGAFGTFSNHPLGFYTNLTERLRITSDGKVGIGTSSPAVTLDVIGPIYGGNGTITGGISYSTRAEIGSISNHALGLITNSTTRMVIDTAGKVGIGTSSPLEQLHVEGRVLTNAVPNTTGVSDWFLKNAVATTSSFGVALGMYVNDNGNNAYSMTFGVQPSYLVGLTEAMRLTFDGKLGIGTSSPLTKLDVRNGVITAGSTTSTGGSEILRGYYDNGTITVIGSEYSSGGIVIGSAVKPSTSAPSQFLSSTNINIERGAYTIAGNIHKWYVGSLQTVPENSLASTTEVMRINGAGNVGIGTSSPLFTLDVVGSGISTWQSTVGSQGILLLKGNSGAAAGTTIESTYNSGGYGPLTFVLGGAEKMRITADGKVGIGRSTLYNQFSVSGPQASDSLLGATVGPALVANATNNADTPALQSVLSLYRDGKPTVSYGNMANFNMGRYSQSGTASQTQLTLRLTQGNQNDPDTDVMTWLADGKVGIGTSSPSGQLSLLSANDDIWATAPGLVLNASSGGASTITSYLDTSAIRIGAGTTQKTGVLITGHTHADGSTVQFRTGNSERARIDSSGRLLVGTSSSRLYTSLGNPRLQVEGTAFADSSIGATNNQTTVDGAYLILAKTRGTSLGSYTTVNTGDLLGSIWFQGADGTALVRGAVIEAVVDSTPGASDMPSRLVFSTTADGSATPTERMRITNNGEVKIGTALVQRYNSVDVGFFSYDPGTGVGTDGQVVVVCRGNDGAGTFQGVGLTRAATSWGTYSDERLKTDLVAIDHGLDKVASLRSVTGRYIVDEPGTSRSFLIAQDVQQVLPEAVGAEDPDKLSLRYTEVIPLLVAALKESKQRIETLEAKVAALEGS